MKKSKRSSVAAYCFLSFFMAVGLAIIGYGLHNLYYANASLSWHTCEGTVTKSRVSSGGGRGRTRYSFFIRYDYIVAGEQHAGWRYSFGSDSDRIEGECRLSRARRLVAQYPVDSTVKVYYDPNTPKRSVIIPGQGRSTYNAIMLGSIFFLFALLFLICLCRSRSDVFRCENAPSRF